MDGQGIDPRGLNGGVQGQSRVGISSVVGKRCVHICLKKNEQNCTFKRIIDELKIGGAKTSYLGRLKRVMQGIDIVGIGQVGVLGGKDFLGCLVLLRSGKVRREVGMMVLELCSPVVAWKP